MRTHSLASRLQHTLYMRTKTKKQSIKQIKFDSIESWTTAFEKFPSSQYQLKRCDLGQLNKLTTKQLTTVLRLIGAAFSYGADTQRAWVKSKGVK